MLCRVKMGRDWQTFEMLGAHCCDSWGLLRQGQPQEHLHGRGRGVEGVPLL